MKTVGIIAEYNPFHNGHRYQIEQARKLTNADYVIVVMSGSFVQRGTPAWTDQYLRAQMALDGGADMVFALPTA
ncbi:MAG: nucleotidyltransferase family protein, partial [Lachnospiraceae bacterium]|nr:nucleotidyltransferase family protein [Lachnospiraceae bacterium]